MLHFYVMNTESLLLNPMDQFSAWFDEATKRSDLHLPDAACLSTLSKDGYPDGRIVLVKAIDKRGVVFYTNSKSQKGQDLAQHPKASLNIYWNVWGRQVRIQGDVTPVSPEESDIYFQSRPRESQLGAWASQQSEPLASRETLIEQLEHYRQKYDGQDVPRPEHWIGYLLSPIKMEFWIDQPARLHDRFTYTKQSDQSWTIQRLNP